MYHLLTFQVNPLVVAQKKWMNCNYLKGLDQSSNQSMYLFINNELQIVLLPV